MTDDEEIAQEVRIFRNYGSEKRYYNKVVGSNSRLDEMQAGLLRVRLYHLRELEEEKMRICDRYLAQIRNKNVLLPKLRENATHIWHQFVIRTSKRDELIRYLEEKGIGSIIHYPIPPHMAEAYQYLGIGEGSLPVTELFAREVLSLPLYNGMTDEEQEYVIRAINAWRE